jgi:hypothetical protein
MEACHLEEGKSWEYSAVGAHTVELSVVLFLQLTNPMGQSPS